jgi:hypothetical protein
MSSTLLPPIFCRDPRPLSERDLPYSPLPDYSLREWYVLVLASALPLELEAELVRRFLEQAPTRASQQTPLALPSVQRSRYDPAWLAGLQPDRFCTELTVEAELIERTLNAPAGAISELSRHHLLAVHVIRLRQLWAEFCRRRWLEGWLPAFRRAFGISKQ